MKTQNGVQIYEKGEEIKDLPGDLKAETYANFYAPYGLKIVEIRGKHYWTPGTKEEVIRSEAKRLGVPESKVKLFEGCHIAGPNRCSGGCPIGERGICSLIYNPPNSYCMCV
jgi:hypothetical protein